MVTNETYLMGLVIFYNKMNSYPALHSLGFFVYHLHSVLYCLNIFASGAQEMKNKYRCTITN